MFRINFCFSWYLLILGLYSIHCGVFINFFFFFWSSVSVKILPVFEESLASEVEALTLKTVGLLEGPREYYTK